jgi:pimeloyl-ACP methyl ester carboxylesterase
MSTVRIDGTDIHYRECGDGAPLLLIHGNGGGSIVWGDTVENLPRDFRVIAYDRRGFGHSTCQPVTDFDRHGRDAAGPAPGPRCGTGNRGRVEWRWRHRARSRRLEPRVVGALVLAEPPLHAKRHLTFRMAAAAPGTSEESRP